MDAARPARCASPSTTRRRPTRCSTTATIKGACPSATLAVLLQPSWAPGIALLALSILLFPDGEIPPGRWRLPLGVFAVGCVVWLVAAYGIAVDAIVSNRVHIDSTGNLLLEDHPTGAWAWWSVYQNVFFLVSWPIGLAWIVAQIPAYRRATGVRRAQLKWLMLGAATALVGGLVTVTALGRLGRPRRGRVRRDRRVARLRSGSAIGILRYRLYDIDRLISRTLSYALLTGAAGRASSWGSCC